MRYVQPNEIRKRQSEYGRTVYVLGEDVRTDLLALHEAIKDKVQSKWLPDNRNHNDHYAVTSMDEWLVEGRFFNQQQLSKYFKMLAKFKMPTTLKALAEELGWIIGRNLTKDEMFGIMQERRDIVMQKKNEKFQTARAQKYAHDSMYNALFEE